MSARGSATRSRSDIWSVSPRTSVMTNQRMIGANAITDATTSGLRAPNHSRPSLLVMAVPEEMPRIKDLVARLDVEVIEPERNFHIYKVENARADELADVLDEFLSDAERLTGTTQGGTGGRAQGGGGGGGRPGGNTYF